MAPPLGLVLTGDLTEDGKPSEWRSFQKLFGNGGTNGQLHMPLYAVVGNHDKNRSDVVARELAARYGGQYYDWRWGSLHLIALSEGPDEWGLSFLTKKLARLGHNHPVVLFLHYPLLGPFSRGNWFGDGNFRQELAATIAGFRIIAIFHGHWHGSGHYRWHGFDVYNVGSPKHSSRSFAVVRVTAERLVVSSWNAEGGHWWWWHARSIEPNGKDAEEVLGADPGPDSRFQPAVPYPIEG